MLDIAYYIFIFPLESAMDFILRELFLELKNYGASIIALSIVVNTALLPLYYLAQKWQAKDAHLQDLMRDEIDEIKRHYKGQERHYDIQAIYRRFGYHPFSAIKASAGFLVQIPFFFAAFHLIANHQGLNGVSFAFLQDLSRPDAAFGALNILPILMTLFNIASLNVYTLKKKSKVSLLPLYFW